MATVAIFAVATVHVSLLSIARLAARFRWVFLIAMQAIFGLALLLTRLIVGEIDDELMIRFIVTVSIVVGALTMVIPLLHRISKTDMTATPLLTPLEQRNLAAIDDEVSHMKRKIAELEKLRAQLVNASAPHFPGAAPESSPGYPHSRE